jgi:hypothetical protein
VSDLQQVLHDVAVCKAMSVQLVLAPVLLFKRFMFYLMLRGVVPVYQWRRCSYLSPACQQLLANWRMPADGDGRAQMHVVISDYLCSS